MDKYLFLDIDGVLNTEQHRAFLVASQQDLEDYYGELFDPQAVIQLEHIVEETSPKIVISSSWKEYGIDYLNEMWWFRKMPSHIISVTPTLISTNYVDTITGREFTQPERYAKGLEINTWLHEHGASNLPYCIVDDEDCFFINQADHLVKTDSKNGLTREIADRIIEILKGEMNKKH